MPQVSIMAGAVRGLYDVIVVGAGVEGSSAAYHIVKQGAERVLLLEQVTYYGSVGFTMHTVI